MLIHKQPYEECLVWGNRFTVVSLSHETSMIGQSEQHLGKLQKYCVTENYRKWSSLITIICWQTSLDFMKIIWISSSNAIVLSNLCEILKKKSENQREINARIVYFMCGKFFLFVYCSKFLSFILLIKIEFRIYVGMVWKRSSWLVGKLVGMLVGLELEQRNGLEQRCCIGLPFVREHGGIRQDAKHELEFLVPLARLRRLVGNLLVEITERLGNVIRLQMPENYRKSFFLYLPFSSATYEIWTGVPSGAVYEYEPSTDLAAIPASLAWIPLFVSYS